MNLLDAIRQDANHEGHSQGFSQCRKEMVWRMVTQGADRNFVKSVAGIGDDELTKLLSEA